MKKVDFTIKGTKLPMIPKGTEYRTEMNNKRLLEITDDNIGIDKLKTISISECGKNILASWYDEDMNCYIFPLSTIEALAEEQGMLYEKEEAPKNHFKHSIELINEKYPNGWSVLEFKEVIDDLNSYFKDSDFFVEPTEYCGIDPTDNYPCFEWTPFKTLITKEEYLYETRGISEPPVSIPPSLRDLLQQASVSEYIIRTGCQMFSGVDENERLEQIKQEWGKLREVVKQLNNILNEKK